MLSVLYANNTVPAFPPALSTLWTRAFHKEHIRKGKSSPKQDEDRLCVLWLSAKADLMHWYSQFRELRTTSQARTAMTLLVTRSKCPIIVPDEVSLVQFPGCTINEGSDNHTARSRHCICSNCCVVDGLGSSASKENIFIAVISSPFKGRSSQDDRIMT